MKMRVYPIEIEVNDSEEILISQDRGGGSGTATIAISPDQVDHLHRLLQVAQREIEERRTEEDE